METQLEKEIEKAAILFKQKENENNWKSFDRAFELISQAIAKTSDKELVVQEIKKIKEAIVDSVRVTAKCRF